MRNIILALLLLVPWTAFNSAVAQEDYDCTLDNIFMTRIIGSDYGIRTNKIVNKITGTRYDVTSSGFRLLLDADGEARELRSNDFEVRDFVRGDDSCEYDLANGEYNIYVKMKFELPADLIWSRKLLTVESPDHVIKVIEVERFRLGEVEVERFDERGGTKPPWNWTGGRPLFVDRQLFMGLEYPAGYNEESDGVFVLHHYPGRSGVIEAKPAVIGVSGLEPGEGIEEAFDEYIDRIRYRPPERFILWNAYFHKYGSGGGMSETFTPDMLKNKFEKGRKAFIEVGVKPDCVLMDGGWADPKSLMKEDSRAPDRVSRVRELAQKYLDAPIGLHVITHGIRNSIDKQWLAENFDMIDEEAYCFADPRAADMQINNLIDIMGRHHPAAFKFDWGRFRCDREDHRGHLPGERFAREAITDNHIRMLDALHQADPDIYLYNTGWHSPWWLMYYDAVFSGEDDYNNALVGPPSFFGNDLQVTWRDAVILKNIVEPRTQFPLDSLMNHSPITWKWQHDFTKYDGGSLESFSNMILMNYLRGNALIEVFMNVFNLTDEEREIWGQVTKWAKENDGILLSGSKYIGGVPFNGDVYGYAHVAEGNRGIIGVRNPGITTNSFSVALDDKIGFRDNGGKHRVRISYPYEAELGDGFKYGDRISLGLERGQLMVIDIEPAPGAAVPEAGFKDYPEVGVAQAQQLRRDEYTGSMSADYVFDVAEDLDAHMVILSKLYSYRDQKNVSLDLKVNGEPAEAERIENCSGKDEPTFDFEPHEGWVIFRLPLAAGKSRVEYQLVAPNAETSGWLMTETPAADGTPVFQTGLPAKWATTVKSEIKLF